MSCCDEALAKKMQAMSGSTADEKPPPPPAGSAHDGWPESEALDVLQMASFQAEFSIWP